MSPSDPRSLPSRPGTIGAVGDWRGAAILLLVGLAVTVLWRTPIVWPLRVLVVFFHELSHGLAAIATGGAIERIEVVAAEGGLCYTRGGSAFLTLSAGYLGSLAWGAAALLAAARTRHDRAVLAALGGVILAATLLWVRPILSFGFGFHALAAVAILAVAAWLPAAVADGALRVFGVTSCLYVVPDIYSDTIARSGLVSDARLLAGRTGLPTVVWGALWIVIALVVVVATLRRAAAAPPGASGRARRRPGTP